MEEAGVNCIKRSLACGGRSNREANSWIEFVSQLDIPAEAKERLMQLTPATYIGKAIELAKRA